MSTIGSGQVGDSGEIALRALVWTLAEPARAVRFLDLTGLDPASLRATAGSPATLAAVLGFLESHQPDLIACAAGLGVPPEALVAARTGLDG